MRTTRSLSATATRLFTSARHSLTADRGWTATERPFDRMTGDVALYANIRKIDR